MYELVEHSVYCIVLMYKKVLHSVVYSIIEYNRV